MSWDDHDRIQDLKDFRETLGHCRVKRRFKGNPALAAFVFTMRNYKNKIKRGAYSGYFLTVARINELDEPGFEWNEKEQPTNMRLFEQRIDQLKAFKELHGHLRITDALDKNLASYCGRMRQARLKPNSGGLTITEEKIMALDELGFEWNEQLQRPHLNVRIRSFEERIEQLTAFKEAHGHLRVTGALDKKLAAYIVNP